MNNESANETVTALQEPKRLAFFERYLTVWVLLCMVVGIAFGKLLPDLTATLSKLEFGKGSQVNVPIGILLWLMIYPMMLKVDFSAIGGIAKKPKGLVVTLIINWLVKPFSMAFLAWLFMQHIFSAWIAPEMAKEYTAGLIILAAAPCTAMVFVWSYLTDGDPVYTLVQVAVNDLIMLVAFAPIVMFLCGVANVYNTPQKLDQWLRWCVSSTTDPVNEEYETTSKDPQWGVQGQGGLGGPQGGADPQRAGRTV
jgi:ACR3 family arsenite transporter